MEARATKAAAKAGAEVVRDAAEMPRSCTSLRINLAGIGMAIVAVVLLRYFGTQVDNLNATLIAIGALGGTIALLELVFLRTWRRSSTGFDFSKPHAPRHGRAVAKIVGFYATLAFGLGIYALFTEYHGSFYDLYYQMLRRVLPVVAVLALPYFLVLERYDQRPHDGYWQMSLVLRGRFGAIDRKVLGQHLLGWTVKVFFTPLMFIYCSNAISRLRTFDVHSIFLTFNSFFDFSYDTFYNFDVILAVTGYLVTVRLLDSHIRSTEPTFLGWAVALGCYQPFWSFIEGNYLTYGAGGTTWGYWLAGMPVLSTLWACAIMALTAIYVCATLPFGIRFSNLTHRGILTNGPYRFTKHPAYVSKNLSWWLISMPFLSTAGWQDALRHSVMLLALNFMYFMRARTEERHLSRDPDYVAYATAMERRSVLRWVGRIAPVLRFKPGQLFNVREQHGASLSVASSRR